MLLSQIVLRKRFDPVTAVVTLEAGNTLYDFIQTVLQGIEERPVFRPHVCIKSTRGDTRLFGKAVDANA